MEVKPENEVSFSIRFTAIIVNSKEDSSQCMEKNLTKKIYFTTSGACEIAILNLLLHKALLDIGLIFWGHNLGLICRKPLLTVKTKPQCQSLNALLINKIRHDSLSKLHDFSPILCNLFALHRFFSFLSAPPKK